MPRRIDLGTEKMSREYFRGVKGRTDIIALLEVPIQFEGEEKADHGIIWCSFNHCVWPNGRDQKPVQVKCRETDDCAGCQLSIKKPEMVDPSGKGDPFKRKYSALVAWLGTKTDDVDEKFRPVGKVLPWRFGGDKARDLKPLLAEGGPSGSRIEIVEHDFAGTKIRLYDVDIRVVCRSKHDEDVQKLGLTVSDVLDGKMRYAGKKLQARIGKEFTEAMEESVMPATVLPLSNAELLANIQRIMKDDSFEFGANVDGDAPAKESADDEFGTSGTKAAEKLADDFGATVDAGDAAEKKDGEGDTGDELFD